MDNPTSSRAPALSVPSRNVRRAFPAKAYQAKPQLDETRNFKGLFDYFGFSLIGDIQTKNSYRRAQILRSHIHKRTVQFAIDSYFASSQIRKLRADINHDHPATVLLETRRLDLITQYTRFINIRLHTLLRTTLDLVFYDRLMAENQKPHYQIQDTIPQLVDFPEWAVFLANSKADMNILDILKAANGNTWNSNPANSLSNLRALPREIENQLHATCTEQSLFEAAYDIYTICSQTHHVKSGYLFTMFHNHVLKSCKTTPPGPEMIDKLERGDIVILHEIQKRIEDHSEVADWLSGRAEDVSEIVQEHRTMAKRLGEYEGIVLKCIEYELVQLKRAKESTT